METTNSSYSTELSTDKDHLHTVTNTNYSCEYTKCKSSDGITQHKHHQFDEHVESHQQRQHFSYAQSSDHGVTTLNVPLAYSSCVNSDPSNVYPIGNYHHCVQQPDLGYKANQSPNRNGLEIGVTTRGEERIYNSEDSDRTSTYRAKLVKQEEPTRSNTRSPSENDEDINTPTEQPDSITDTKPPMTYIALIAKSILQSPYKRLNLGSIYQWIETNHPYYVNKGQGWRNSVRHNLSLNDCFIKVGRCEDGKGNYWAVHPANYQDFLQGDFRQRRRSRRRGRKRERDLDMYDMPNVVIPQSTFSPNMSVASAVMNPVLYSPYTEAERRAYRLDEALRQQGMNTSLWNWMNKPASYPYDGTKPNMANGNYGPSSSQWTEFPVNPDHQAAFPFNYTYQRYPI